LVPTRIYVTLGVVVYVDVLMDTWRIPEIRYNGVRIQESAAKRRVKTGAEVEQSWVVRVTVPPLPREPVSIPPVAYSNASV
jgi:hypothetical protein